VQKASSVPLPAPGGIVQRIDIDYRIPMEDDDSSGGISSSRDSNDDSSGIEDVSDRDEEGLTDTVSVRSGDKQSFSRGHSEESVIHIGDTPTDDQQQQNQMSASMQSQNSGHSTSTAGVQQILGDLLKGEMNSATNPSGKVPMLMDRDGSTAGNGNGDATHNTHQSGDAHSTENKLDDSNSIHIHGEWLIPLEDDPFRRQSSVLSETSRSISQDQIFAADSDMDYSCRYDSDTDQSSCRSSKISSSFRSKNPINLSAIKKITADEEARAAAAAALDAAQNTSATKSWGLSAIYSGAKATVGAVAGSVTSAVVSSNIATSISKLINGDEEEYTIVDDKFSNGNKRQIFEEKLRFYLNKDPSRKVYMYIHGGGYLLCNAGTVRPYTYNVVKQAMEGGGGRGSIESKKLIFFVPNYKKPPFECKTLDDSVEELYSIYTDYLLGTLKIEPSRIVFWSDSAGGGHAALLLNRIVEDHKQYLDFIRQRNGGNTHTKQEVSGGPGAGSAGANRRSNMVGSLHRNIPAPGQVVFISPFMNLETGKESILYPGEEQVNYVGNEKRDLFSVKLVQDACEYLLSHYAMSEDDVGDEDVLHDGVESHCSIGGAIPEMTGDENREKTSMTGTSWTENGSSGANGNGKNPTSGQDDDVQRPKTSTTAVQKYDGKRLKSRIYHGWGWRLPKNPLFGPQFWKDKQMDQYIKKHREELDKKIQQETNVHIVEWTEDDERMEWLGEEMKKLKEKMRKEKLVKEGLRVDIGDDLWKYSDGNTDELLASAAAAGEVQQVELNPIKRIDYDLWRKYLLKDGTTKILIQSGAKELFCDDHIDFWRKLREKLSFGSSSSSGRGGVGNSGSSGNSTVTSSNTAAQKMCTKEQFGGKGAGSNKSRKHSINKAVVELEFYETMHAWQSFALMAGDGSAMAAVKSALDFVHNSRERKEIEMV